MADPNDMPDGWLDNLTPIAVAAPGFIGGTIALITALFYTRAVLAVPLDARKKETLRIHALIERGAEAFLKQEYTALSCFVVIVAFLIGAAVAWETAVCFVCGAFLSATSGYLGMKIATAANVRTTLSCQGDDGLNNGLTVAFRSGAVMALMVVGSGLVGLSSLYMIFEDQDGRLVWEHLSGFAFGGSSIALFARVGGGIYTKAADVGADLVGKVEEELDEDSPDNPATIADNVGDNVGDVAGMGADLFESFVGSIIASATLGFDLRQRDDPSVGGDGFPFDLRGVAYPFWVSGFGAIAAIIGTLFVRAQKKGDVVVREHEMNEDGEKLSAKMIKAKESEHILEALLGAIRKGIYSASFLVIAFSALSVCIIFGPDNEDGWRIFVCVVIGLICGIAIGYFTEVATSYTYFPTQSIALKSNTGPATVLIQGLGVGMISTVPPVFFIVATILGAFYVSEPRGVYGISITAVGMLSTLGVTLATDAFGPVADNAGGIAEMAPDDEISDEVRETTDALDALGNTTAATGKGFAIGSAVLTALALQNAFADTAKLDDVSLLDPVVLPGVLIGALLPFLFAALTMLSVGKAAESIMWECRDQMNKKYFEGEPLKPEKCVSISTISSLIEMVVPGTLAVFMPIIIGYMFGSRGLLGLLTGAISAGFMLAVMMSNAGGAWDNAKKWVEKGNLGEGKAKKSDNHKAVVVGDTVGDPFKDTSGPALNILIKLMSIVSLVFARELPSEAWDGDNWWIGLVIAVVVGIAGVVFYFFTKKYGALHDKKEIDRQSAERKRQQGVEADEEDDFKTE